MVAHVLRQTCLVVFLVASILSCRASVDVSIKRARSMKPLQIGERTVHRLLGDVLLEHDGAVMRCDSAYLFQENNMFRAYGRVVILSKGLRIVGDSLYYEGELGTGRIFGRNVELRDTVQNYTLWSDVLDYDTQENSVRFSTWGRMRSEKNELESLRGEYLANQSLTILSGEVRFQGEELRSFSDTLEYNSNAGMLYLWGNIRMYRLEQVGLCNKGWYNLNTKDSELRGNVAFRDKGEHFFSDRLYIDSEKKTLEATGHVLLEDSVRQDRTYSEHLFYWSEPRRVVADKAPMLYRVDSASSQPDTLYMRAESFDVKAEALEREALGSVKRDTVYHIWALGQVRSYRNDFQIACDTLYVNGRDSLFTLQGKPYPYLWNGKSQISAEHIAGYLGKQGVDSMHFEDKVFVGMQDRGEYYNQMTGLVMRAYLYDNKLRIIRMEGEGDVIFFMREDEELIGVNRIKSPRYKIEVVDNEASEAVFYTTTESVMLPLAETQQEDRVLYGFKWRNDLRPKSKEDIIPSWLQDLNFHTTLRARIDACYEKEGGAARKMSWRHEI